MKLSDFQIDFIKFKNEKDSFHFKLDDTFFGLKENSLYNSCEIDVTVICTRNDDKISIDYGIKGVVSYTCERCLENIELMLDTERNDLIKLTLNPDLIQEENYISLNNQVYNLYDSIYEQICIAMPTRKICKNSILNKDCKISHQNSQSDEPVEDERWAELKKLIKK